VTLPRAWAELMADINGKRLFGQRGVRDPEHPCEEFEPVPDIDWLGLRLAAPGTGHCDSDGHYLCGGCRNLSERGRQERIAPC
jgi:hypothetical protein